MKPILTTVFLVFSLSLLAHRGEFVSIENVNFHEENGQTIIDFDLENIQKKVLQGIKIELVVNDISFLEIQASFVSDHEQFKHYQFLISSDQIDNDKDKVQIEITELFGKKHDWGGWDNPNAEKQVNTLYSEFYADAPWRMKKTDELGNVQGIPVHFFLHDADLIPGLDLQIDNINIQVKSATDPTFGSVLTYNSIPLADLNNMFSCMSQSDNDLDIKEFELNSFSPSASQTFDFDIDTDLFDEFVEVTEKYWYFTFTIPPSDLIGLNDIVDILVTIEYANFSISDDFIGMRVFRSDEDMPTIPNYYRGDTHLHSMYTQSEAEIGLPLCATKEAAKLTGQDWITTTDHTSDFDNYGTSIQTNWQRIKNEASALNLQDTSLMYIPGLEVSLNNSKDNLVHMLAYPNPFQPSSMPFLGDGNGDLVPTSATIDNTLAAIETFNGFVYLAHPFATGDELPTVPVDGGIWNLGEINFPQNGGVFPLDGGSIVCNDINFESDVLSPIAGQLVKEGIKGGQIWNSRNTLTTTDDELDPWSVMGNSTPFSQFDTSNVEFHFRRFRQGQEVINHINKLGLQYKNADTSYQNWKLYYSAGTDAHGSFNSSNTDDFASLGTITNNAVGKLSTVTYCPSGMGSNGEDVLVALRDGNTTLSDGPLVTIGVSNDGNNVSNEIFMGEDAILNSASLGDYFLNLNYSTTIEFGDVTQINFYLGTEQGEFERNVSFTQTNGNVSLNYQFDVLLDSILGVGNTPLDEYMYIRAELRSEVDYTGLESEYRTSFDVFHSISNPIWFKYKDITGIDELVEGFVKVYPNPTNDILNFEFNSNKEKQIIVYDQAGRIVVHTSTILDKEMLEISQLRSGMYHINVVVGDERLVMKFVKL